jgi:ABC-type branched-subunit amino acid transport system substrate-binding protein
MKLGTRASVLLAASILAAASGCSTKAPDTAAPGGDTGGDGEVKVGRGIEGSTITLGVLTDLTGVFAALGADITNANTLYWEKQNAGDKVCGKYDVELDVKDTGYVPQQGVQLYSGMKDGILAMQQTIGSPINTALADAYTADSIVNLPSAWARNLTEAPGNGVVGATYDVELTNGLGYALDEGLIKEGDTLGHIYFEGEYGANGLAGSKYMATKHDFKVVEAKIKPTDQDMSAQITQFKAAGVKAIVLTVAPGQTASAAGAAATQGLDVPIIGSNPVFAPGLLKGPAAEVLKKNLIVSSPINTFDKHPEILADYKAKYPSVTPSLGVLFGYGMSDVMRQILDKACENGDLTPEGVLAAKGELTDIDTGDLIVPLNFSKVGASPSTQNFILQPADVDGGAKALTEAIESPDVAGLG